MLFDLGSGRKKRVVQIVYAALALLFVIGFVGFGVGTSSNGGGGILDIFTGGSDSLQTSQFSKDADEIEKKLAAQPHNQDLLVQLISTRYSAGNALVTTDETGQPVITEEAQQQYEKAADAWDQYLATHPDPINTGAATFAVSALTTLAQSASTPLAADTNWKGAADAQELLVKRRQTVGNFSNLAFYSYASLDFKRGDEAAARAAALAANPAAAKRIKKQLAGFRKQAQAYKVARARQEQQQNQGNQNGAPEVPQNPLGDLGGSSGLTPTPTP
jgi:hypothetical protein